MEILNTPLITLNNNQGYNTEWTVRNAVEGVQIFGGIGSGKTSGSGRMLALKYLKAGFGGLVLTVKPDEKELWEDYCKLAGRLEDIVVIEPNGDYFFNVLDYESSDGNTENIVQVLKTVINASEEKSGNKSSDPFWDTALDMLLFNVVDLCRLAYGRVTFKSMYEIVQTLPTAETRYNKTDNKLSFFMQAYTHAQKNAYSQSIDWYKKNNIEINDNGDPYDFSFEEKMMDAVPDARIMKEVDQFFVETYAQLSEKTRSIIDFSCSGFLFKLLREPIYSLFCKNESNIIPEDCIDGKIILLNLPVKIYHKIGRDCQIMFKYIWQRAMEKRDFKTYTRPVFLWADEAQNFLHEYDADYQATARSSGIATVYISQNMPNYYGNMGGNKFEYKVKSSLGTLATKIFHANSDIETNKYASDLIGDIEYQETSKTISIAGKPQISRNRSLRIDRSVRPEEFIKLKTGADINNNIVEGFIHVQGNPIMDGLNYSKVSFSQKYEPESELQSETTTS